MKIYRFDIAMEGYPDVRRVIDISAEKTFEDLHLAILESVGFDATQLASFYICNDIWERKLEITLIDMEPDERDISPTMRDAKLKDYMGKPGQKLLYEYDFVLMWSFRIILDSIRQPEEVKYPLLVHTEGDAPNQYETKDRYPEEITEEDARYIRELEMKNTSLFLPGEEDESWGGDEFGVDEDDLFSEGGYSEEEDY